MKTRDDLKEHQLRAINFTKQKKKCGLFMGMSLGKTVISLTSAIELIKSGKINKFLVIAPKMVALDNWNAEIGLWEHLKDLTIINLTGLKPTERKEKLETSAQVYIINKEMVSWLYDHDRDWDMIIVDESSCFKSHAANCFKDLSEFHYEYMVLLTGTPTPNGMHDLWSQIYLLDKGERLGKNITTYRNRYFMKDYTGFKWVLQKPESYTRDLILDKIKDIILTMDTEDYIELPDQKLIYHRIDNPKPQMYKDIENKTLIYTDTIEATNYGMVLNKLLQFCNGTIYGKNDKPQIVHTAKVDALQEIIDYHGTDNLLVAYNFKSDLVALEKRFPHGVRLDGAKWTIDQWNKGKIPLMFAHPASCGKGLNLQFGGNTIVWFGLTYNLENYLQFNARLRRYGQTKKTAIYHISVKNSVEDKILHALEHKLDMHNYLFKYLSETIKPAMLS